MLRSSWESGNCREDRSSWKEVGCDEGVGGVKDHSGYSEVYCTSVCVCVSTYPGVLPKARPHVFACLFTPEFHGSKS